MIQLDDIPNLASLVSSFDQQQLANFCRILAVTISELDTGSDDKHTLLAKNAQQKKNLGPSRAEINQGNCCAVNKSELSQQSVKSFQCHIVVSKKILNYIYTVLQALLYIIFILSYKAFFLIHAPQIFPGNIISC